MDFTEKIEELVSENELLQLQLSDMESSLKNKDREIALLADGHESHASLLSRIDSNLAEIQQLRYNEAEAAQKAAGTEIMNEELEISLLAEIRENQKKEAALKKFKSLSAELEIITGELEENVGHYSRATSLAAENAELKSRVDCLEHENSILKTEKEELQALLAHVKSKKMTDQ